MASDWLSYGPECTNQRASGKKRQQILYGASFLAINLYVKFILIFCCEFRAQSGWEICNIAVLFKIYSRDFRMIDSCELPSTLMIGPSD